jgi:hypothetical protein
MTHKALKRSFTFQPQKQHVAKAFACAPLLLAGCRKERDELGFEKGKKLPAIVDNADGTKTVMGSDIMSRPFGNTIQLPTDELLTIAAVLIVFGLSTKKSILKGKKEE